ncbi:MAG: GHKL domain-containing protein [Lachnospira sp.]|nr:GHKL domain-containing protein [Lachnospira sp.]
MVRYMIIACSNLAQVFILMALADIIRKTFFKKETEGSKKELIIAGIKKIIGFAIIYTAVIAAHYHLLCLRKVMNYPSVVIMMLAFALFNYYSQQIDRKKYDLLLNLIMVLGIMTLVAVALFGNLEIFAAVLYAVGLLIADILIMTAVDKRKFRFYEGNRKNELETAYNYAVVLINYVLLFVMYAIHSVIFEEGNIILGAQQQGIITVQEIVFIVVYTCAAFICVGIQITTENYEKMLKDNINELSRNKDINVYKDIKELYDKTAIIRHDIKHTLGVINAYLSEEEYEKAENYIEEIIGTCEKGKIQNYSNNLILNYVLNNKRETCKKNNIDFKCVCIGNINGIEDEDICLLMGNLLDNAIEAAARCDKGKVSVDINEGNEIEIRISNSIMETVLKDNPELKTTKTDNKKHGYGTRSIRFIVKKYQGEIQYHEYKNMMVCYIKMLSKYDVTY